MPRDELSPLQERFCAEFVKDPRRVAGAAAVRAGYSPKTAPSQASRLLKSVQVKNRIRELEMEALESAGFGRDEVRAMVMRELVRIARSDITDVVATSPGLEDPHRMDALQAHAAACGGQLPLDFGGLLIYPTGGLSPDTTGAIRSIRQAKDTVAIEMHDKLGALRTLAEIVELTKAQQTNVAVSVGGLLSALEGSPDDAPAPASDEVPPNDGR